jgi:hypothetical protein
VQKKGQRAMDIKACRVFQTAQCAFAMPRRSMPCYSTCKLRRLVVCYAPIFHSWLLAAAAVCRVPVPCAGAGAVCIVHHASPSQCQCTIVASMCNRIS